jgi:hypothetical protein
MYPAATVAGRIQDPANLSSREAAELQNTIEDVRNAIRAAGSVGTSAANPPGLIGTGRPLSGFTAGPRELQEVLASLQRVEWTLKALRRKQPLNEFVFPNQVPGIGGLVAFLQEQVGRISARWYSRHLILQQNEINTLLLLSIDGLTVSVHQLADAVARLSADAALTTEPIANGEPEPTQTSRAGQRHEL